jgi:uncharacterized protein (DUF885 family)
MAWHSITVDKLDEIAAAGTTQAIMEHFGKEYRTAGAPDGAEVWLIRDGERREFLFNAAATSATPETMHRFGAKQVALAPSDPSQSGFKKLEI